jgi:hypothetical protein
MTQYNTNTREMQTNVQASNGIQTHNPSASAGEGLRHRGRCDQLSSIVTQIKSATGNTIVFYTVP